MSTRRWYGTAVTLPTGQVLAFSGADRDEVILPGSETPVRTTDMFDPGTKTWRSLASQDHGRTYHNTAVLLPDGRVLVGGHAPIATAYGNQNDAGTNAGLGSPYRDPTFQIFSPPSLFYGPRPVITSAPSALGYGSTTTVATTDAKDIASAVLVRNTASTHLVDGDQRWSCRSPVVRRPR